MCWLSATDVLNPLLITARVAKRAKVMFLQACVTHSVQLQGGGGGRWHTKCNMGPGQNVYPPPGTRSECLPPPPLGPGQNVYPPPPGTRSECLSPPPPGPGQNVYPPPPPPPWDQVRMSTPSPPGTRSECLPPPPKTTRRRAVRILLECILVL